MSHWKEPVHRWLAAERSHRGAAAEAALTEIFGLLRDPHAPAGFVAEVLRRLEGRPVAVLLPASLRGAIAVAMIAAALSVAIAPALLSWLSDLVTLGMLVELAGAALAGASRALATGLAFWESLARVSAVAWSLVSRPQIALLVLGATAISAVGLRLFASLVTSDRSSGYA